MSSIDRRSFVTVLDEIESRGWGPYRTLLHPQGWQMFIRFRGRPFAIKVVLMFDDQSHTLTISRQPFLRRRKTLNVIHLSDDRELETLCREAVSNIKSQLSE